jgi:hypothetical protein
MSLWGKSLFALNTYFWYLFFLIFFIVEECLVTTNFNLFSASLINLYFLRKWKMEYFTSFSEANLNNNNFNKFQLLNSEIGLNEKNNKKIIRLRSDSRIGPHNKNIFSIIFGSLLGDGYAEYRSKGKGTRISFYQEGSHLSYLLWLHKYLSDLGYCNPIVPKIHTRLGKKGVVRKIIRFHTWTYSSFNWIQELWYKNGTKVVPLNIGDYLDSLALAI